MALSQGQLGRLLVAAVLLGLCLGVVFDLLRLFRALLDRSHPRYPRAHALLLQILLFWQDLFFVLASSWSLVILLYYTNDGQVRLLAVCGMACGFLLYRRTVGRMIARMTPRMAAALQGFAGRCVSLLGIPLRLVGGLIAHLWRCTAGKYLSRCRRRYTQRRTETMIRQAAQGFGLPFADQTPQTNSKNSSHDA